MKLELSSKKVSRNRFEELKKITGFNIPYTFFDLVKENDGAYPNPDAFSYIDYALKKSLRIGVGAFLCINTDEYGDILERFRNPPEFFPKNILAFAEVGNGDYICFDYREGKDNPNPPIVYWNHEADIGKDVSFIAKDFETFMGMLKVDEEG